MIFLNLITSMLFLIRIQNDLLNVLAKFSKNSITKKTTIKVHLRLNMLNTNQFNLNIYISFLFSKLSIYIIIRNQHRERIELVIFSTVFGIVHKHLKVFVIKFYLKTRLLLNFVMMNTHIRVFIILYTLRT